MLIDSYKFGKIVINGTSYDSDIIVIGDSVISNWWRKKGHSLSSEDLNPVIEAKPSTLIVGCGASSMMNVPAGTLDILMQHNIETEILDTHKAVQRFNQYASEGKNVAAALHLTC